MNVHGKRLLILGGTTLMIHVVEIAQKMGVFTIVTDVSPESPAKKVADKAYNISTADIDSLVSLAQIEKIDGVFTAYDDFNTGIAQELCNILNLPFYATKEQLEVTKNKRKFKQLCREYDVPVVEEYYTDKDSKVEDIKKIRYPVIVKPVDSYGSKGISVCKDNDELILAIDMAKKHSKEGNVIIERYMMGDGINIDYVIQDGNIMLSAIGDRYTNNQQEGLAPLSSALVFPSIHTEQYISELNSKVCNMFKSIGIKNGVLFIQAFHDEEGFHFYEMGYRAGGGQTSIIVSKINDIDYVEMLINYALTGKVSKMDVGTKNNPNFNKFACGLTFLLKQGTIGEIYGLEEAKKHPDVINVTQYYYKGDSIKKVSIGTLSQTFIKIHIVSKDKESLVNTINTIDNMIKVNDKNGNEMLLKTFNTRLLK